MASISEIKRALEDLLRLEDIQACLLAERGAGSISPEKGVKLKDISLWNLIKDTTDKFFDASEHFYHYGLSKIYFELGDMEVIMSFIGIRSALIVIVPTLANKGLLEVEIENTRRQIQKLRGI